MSLKNLLSNLFSYNPPNDYNFELPKNSTSQTEPSQDNNNLNIDNDIKIIKPAS